MRRSREVKEAFSSPPLVGMERSEHVFRLRGRRWWKEKGRLKIHKTEGQLEGVHSKVNQQ